MLYYQLCIFSVRACSAVALQSTLLPLYEDVLEAFGLGSLDL